MTNIPRRRIYETMLEYEDAMLELNIVLYHEENFQKYKKSFEEEKIPQLKEAFREVKALFFLFLEHRMFETKEELDYAIKKLLEEENNVDDYLLRNENLSKDFKSNMKDVEKVLKELKSLTTFEQTQKEFEVFDRFNSQVPKALELRRDHMK